MLLWFLLFQSSRLPPSFSRGTGDDRPDWKEKDETFEDQASRKRRGGSAQLELFTNQLDWNPLRGKNLQWDSNSTFVIWRLILLSGFLHFLLFAKCSFYTLSLFNNHDDIFHALIVRFTGRNGRRDKVLGTLNTTQNITSISQVSFNLSSHRVRSTHQWVQQSTTAYFLANES